MAQRGISFDETVVDRDDEETRTDLMNRSGMKTFPQIFHGDHCVGGYTDLAALDAKDSLKSLK